MLGMLKTFMPVLFSTIIACSVMNCAQKKVAGKQSPAVDVNPSVIAIAPDLYKRVPFVENSKTAAPYLAMNIDFDSISTIRKDVEKMEKLSLLNRGEAHITVITPPEFEQLRSVLTIELLNEVAQLNRIQETPFEIVCVGRGQLKESKKTLSAYYVVVAAPALITLRHTIAILYKTRGGLAADFNPDNFYPHITVGFTERDLHQSDGVVKSKATCLIDTQLKAQ
jgi:2'-5' RNA ligase